MTSRLITFIQTANLKGSLKITVPNHFLKLSPHPSLSSSPFLRMFIESLWKTPLICFTSDPESPRVGSVCLPQSELCLHDLKLKRVLNSPNLYRLNSVGLDNSSGIAFLFGAMDAWTLVKPGSGYSISSWLSVVPVFILRAWNGL